MTYLKLDEFLHSDAFQVIFPKYQDKDIRIFADNINTLLGSDVSIIRKATYDIQKRNLKDKDILFIELKNTISGLFGLTLCLHEFEDFIEVKAVKNMHKFEIPKELRNLDDEHYEYLDKFKKKFKNQKSIEELKFKEMNSNLLFKLKSFIKNIK